MLRNRRIRVHRRRAGRAPGRRGASGAGAGTLRRGGGQGRGARRRGRARRARRPRVARRRRRGLLHRLPPRRPPGRVGAVGGLRARQRRGHPQRSRRLRSGGGAPLRPLRHRGGADGRQAARPRRRDRAAATRLAGPLSGDQGEGRAGGPRGDPRGVRDRRRPAPLRLGQGRHHPAAGDGRDRRAGPVRLDRRRPQRHRHRPCRQRRRGHAVGRRERAAWRGLLHHRRRAGRLP